MFSSVFKRIFHTMAASPELKAQIDGYIKSHKVFVASKTYCQYCRSTKDLLQKLKVEDVFVIELDQMSKYKTLTLRCGGTIINRMDQVREVLSRIISKN